MERRTERRFFWVWEFEKEERWLNEMAQNGWTLCAVGWCTYYFERTLPGAYQVKLVMAPKDEGYIPFVESTGAECVGTLFRWVYFRKTAEEGLFELMSDLDSRIEHFERIARFLFLFAVLNIACGLINALGTRGHNAGIGATNLLVASLLMYGLGRICGKEEALKEEREFYE